MYHTHDGRRIKEASPQLQRHYDHHHHPQGVSTMMTNRSEASGLRRESRSSTISSSRKHHRRVLFDEEEILKVLNEYRNQHGSGPLQWSTSCARRAQGRADHSAGGQTTEFGENLARSTNARWEDANVACIAAIHYWQLVERHSRNPPNAFFAGNYSAREESKYNYDRPGMSSDTSNFTNNVWKLTTHVGFGVGKALYKGKTTYFVVAAFSPKGNQIGDFARNVLPKGSVYDGDQNMVKLATDMDPRYGSQPPHFVRVTTVNTEVRHLTSPNGTYSFQMLPDRNIVVRRGKKIVWESGSKSSYNPPVSTPFRLVLQKNGDLVGYDSSSRVFWSSDTANCGPAPYTLSMRDDGYCVLFDGDWKARWATKIDVS